MTTLKDVIRFILDASQPEREAIHVMLECTDAVRFDAVRFDDQFLAMTKPSGQGVPQGKAVHELLKVEPKLEPAHIRRKAKKRKAKRKFKRNLLDVFKKDGPRKQVWFALKSSQGALSANDLAVVLPLKPATISKALGDLWSGRWGRHIVREKDPNRKVKGISYLYRYTGPKVKSDTTLVQDAYGTGMAENDQP